MKAAKVNIQFFKDNNEYLIFNLIKIFFFKSRSKNENTELSEMKKKFKEVRKFLLKID